MNARQAHLVVGIGASAGGLDAFKRLLTNLPSSKGLTLLLVQHLDPTHKRLLAELLAPNTSMPIAVAAHGEPIMANRIYVAPPNAFLGTRNGKLELSAPVSGSTMLPINHLFTSLAHAYSFRAVGVVLSGAGSDGTIGLKEIKAAGGLTIVQEPDSSCHDGMPRSAVDQGVADLVLEVEDIPLALRRFVQRAHKLSDKTTMPGGENADEALVPARLSNPELTKLAALLKKKLDFDLGVYKTGTIERRVYRRMLLCSVDTASDYLRYIHESSAEQRTLARDLLIGVTDFFRDSEAFLALRSSVIDPLVAGAEPGSTLRIWVPGCATGQEAYSIAIELLESMELQDKTLGLQVFATDISQESLSVGRAGFYSEASVAAVSKARLENYFRASSTGYQVCPTLRDSVSFAIHDLTKDPPFSRMQLVSCRNVLIYLTPEAQKHVLKVMHFALEPQGYLFLSTSESVGAHKELFSTVSKPWRIYRKMGVSRPVFIHRTPSRSWSGNAPAANGTLPSLVANRRAGSRDTTRQVILDACLPPSIVVTEDGMVTFTHGELEPFLRFPQGHHPKLELSTILRPEIATRTRGVLYKCRKTQKPAIATSTMNGGNARRVQITAHPAFDLGEEAVILTFEEIERAPSTQPDIPDSPAQAKVIEHLEAELQATREDLRNTLDELEVAVEEHRALNEEAMSMNEELQSANEELEATTEELRSLNEELTTVNTELREKVLQLEQAHDDLNNFLASSKVATIFLDARLCINRFTPAAADLLAIDETETGRYVGNIANELLQNELVGEAKGVLEYLSTHSREIETCDGRWIARQILPYRTESRRIEGVVVTFLDITELKTATERLSLRERQQGTIARIGMQALRGQDLQSFLEQVVREVQDTLNTDYCKILELQPGGANLLLRAGVGWKEGLVGLGFVGTGIDSQAGFTLQSSEPVIVRDLSTEKRFSGPELLVSHNVKSGLSCIIRDGDHTYGVIGAHTIDRRNFTQQDARFLQGVATVVGSAVGRHQVRRRMAVELAVTQILADAVSVRVAIDKILRCIVSELETWLAEAWLLDETSGNLVRSSFYCAEAKTHAAAKVAGEPRQLSVQDDLVVSVFKCGAAMRFAECSDPPALRSEAQRLPGIVSGFGIPISVGAKPLGVITTFSCERLFADENFLRGLDGIGRAVGDFMSRAEVDERARQIAAIIESSHDAIFSYGLDGKVIEWLSGAERVLGYSAEEMVGTSMERIVPDEHLEQIREIRGRLQRGEAVEPFETQRRRKDGKAIEVSVHAAAIRNRTGDIVAISAIDRDISRQKAAERILVDADRQKDEFLAMLGHELRNPLAAIRSAAELLKLKASQDPAVQQTQAVLTRQSAHMAKLLDGLLDVSRIISGKIILEREVVNLAEVCREVVADVAGRISRRQLELRTELNAAAAWIDADKVRLVQVIDNLLSNAIKYTPDGGSVTLKLERENDQAIISIEDTGRGIEPEILPHVFGVFRQAKQSLARAHGGLGLGLALVRSLVELHEGSVEAQSEGEGKGARFIVRLPLTAKPPVHANEAHLTEQQAWNVLVIEDNEDAAEMLSTVLDLLGYEVMVATSGHQGIALAKKQSFDVIICDIGLPDISGFDVARTLRCDAPIKELRLVALSGYGRPEDKRRALKTGFDAHLTKPVETKELEGLLRELIVGSPSIAR